MVMSLDDVMFGMIVGGLGLCVAYFRDGYIAWRKHRAAERRIETGMRKLHFDRLSRHEEEQRSVSGLLTRGD
jgi:hypothetical protein